MHPPTFAPPGAPLRGTIRGALHAALLCLPAAEISLQSAIETAATAAQLDEASEAVRLQSESYRRAASALPNPALFYERETLNGSGATSDTRETTFGIAAPLDFIWKRSTRIASAEARGALAQWKRAEIQAARRQGLPKLDIEAAQKRGQYRSRRRLPRALRRATRVRAQPGCSEHRRGGSHPFRNRLQPSRPPGCRRSPARISQRRSSKVRSSASIRS